MWKVSSEDGLVWVQYDHGVITGDPASVDQMVVDAGKAVPYAPNGYPYTPSSPTDEVGLYLLARTLITGMIVVSGDPPTVQPPSAGRGGGTASLVF